MSVTSIEILGVRVNPISVDQLHDCIDEYIQTDRRALVLHANVHGLNLAYENLWLRQFLNQGTLVFCDGAGVQLAAKLYGHTIPERITYADWMWQLAQHCTRQGYTLFLLGAKPGVAQKAALRLRNTHPGIQIVGVHHGYFCKDSNSEENLYVISMVNRVSPDILVVGFGMPIQEQWLEVNWQLLNTNVILTGGAVFDYTSGELQRGPRFLTDNNFEWLARLFIEPKRLWRRYVIGNPLFFCRILKERFLKA